MDNPLYVTLARLTALERQMDVVANNIANASTIGFKREGTLFAEAVEILPAEGDSLSMSSDPATFTDVSPGVMTETGDPLNAAILGDGMLAIDHAGETVYTRDGRFALSQEGELVLLATGDRVLHAGGAPIQVPPDARQIAIAKDGTVSADGTTLGQLGLYRLDAARLERVGSGLFRAAEPPAGVDQPRFAQGFLEQSNVNPVTELVRMIEIQRAYERGQAILQSEDDRINQVTDVIGNAG